MILLLQYTLTFASVLILVALGGCFSEHSGVINLGLEGVMIMGALGGALAMRYMPGGSSHFAMLLVVLLAAALMLLTACGAQGNINVLPQPEPQPQPDPQPQEPEFFAVR